MELSYTDYIPVYNQSISFYGNDEASKLHRNKGYIVLPYLNEIPKNFEKCLFFRSNTNQDKLYFFELFSENKKKYGNKFHFESVKISYN